MGGWSKALHAQARGTARHGTGLVFRGFCRFLGKSVISSCTKSETVGYAGNQRSAIRTVTIPLTGMCLINVDRAHITLDHRGRLEIPIMLSRAGSKSVGNLNKFTIKFVLRAW